VFGGGKLSQRFWEYFAAIEALDLSPDSVVLDIGGGSPATGISLFPRAVATQAAKVIVMDSSLKGLAPITPRVAYVPEDCSYESLRRVFAENPSITHVSSVSVFEHIPPDVRVDMVRAINDHFKGHTFVVTLEYHPTTCFFEHQLTARSLSDTFTPLKQFFPVQFIESPVFCENAIQRWRPFYAAFMQKILPGRWFFRTEISPPIRQWSPLLIKFIRS
jgi:hypothetical protein